MTALMDQSMETQSRIPERLEVRAGDAVAELVVAPRRPDGALLGRVLAFVGHVVLQGVRLFILGLGKWIVSPPKKTFRHELTATPHTHMGPHFSPACIRTHQLPMQLLKVERAVRLLHP